MAPSFHNVEIILISHDPIEAQWILHSLKVSGMENELFWLKDSQRTFDFLGSSGLYEGKIHSDSDKLFILDQEFPENNKVLKLIHENRELSQFPVLTLAESKEQLEALVLSGKPGRLIRKVIGEINTLSLAI